MLSPGQYIYGSGSWIKVSVEGWGEPKIHSHKESVKCVKNNTILTEKILQIHLCISLVWIHLVSIVENHDFSTRVLDSSQHSLPYTLTSLHSFIWIQYRILYCHISFLHFAPLPWKWRTKNRELSNKCVPYVKWSSGMSPISQILFLRYRQRKSPKSFVLYCF